MIFSYILKILVEDALRGDISPKPLGRKDPFP